MNVRSSFVCSLIALGSPIAFAASEGGDTWAALVAAKGQEVTPAITFAASGSIGGLLASDTVAEATAPLGRPVSPTQADRIVELKPGMRWMNVAYGESVLFKMNGKSFAWRFDAMPTRTQIDLGEIAPADFPMREFRVFIAPQPEYRGG
jgi:hypothetical protein